MANITYRVNQNPSLPGSSFVKAAALTNVEVDANFKALDSAISVFEGAIAVTAGNASFIGTGAVKTPVGSVAQRPGTPLNGMIRMNSQWGYQEWYNAAFGIWEPTGTISMVKPGDPNIGDAYGGGYFGGYISSTQNGIATHRLIVAPKASGETTAQWKNANTATTGADSLWDGFQNTADMVLDGNATVYPAAHWADSLSIAGYTDWYIPARDELEVLYYNLKNVSQANYIAGGNLGVNPSAVPVGRPVSTAYTAARPAQTGLAAWRVGGVEAFADYSFWCSSEASATNAWVQDFYSGYPGIQYNNTKTYTGYVRAVRRLAI